LRGTSVDPDQARIVRKGVFPVPVEDDENFDVSGGFRQDIPYGFRQEPFITTRNDDGNAP